MGRSKDIQLSILLPSFNYSQGLELFVELIKPELSESYIHQCEFIVTDSSDEIFHARKIKSICEKYLSFKYIRTQGLNVGDDWNQALSAANGKYILMVHHDEFPITEGFLKKILDELKSNSPDILLLKMILFNKTLNTVKPHLPDFARNFLLRLPRNFIFQKNYIGATAAFVFKKNVKNFFDANLTWLLDVDFYYQNILTAKSIALSKEIRVGSFVDRRGSITYSLKSNISMLYTKELKYLINKYDLKQNNFFIEFFFSIMWILMRVIDISYWGFVNKFGLNKLRTNKINQILKKLND